MPSVTAEDLVASGSGEGQIARPQWPIASPNAARRHSRANTATIPDMLTASIWSDVACPWCWVGKRHLEQAAAEVGVSLDIRWRAFELNPNAKPWSGEVDYVAKLATKYGASREGAQAMVDRMVSVGAAAGLEFHFDRIRPSSTFDAHRLLALAGEDGLQSELKERLFRAYFAEGKAMSERDVLIECATSVGVDASRASDALDSGAFADFVRADQTEARERDVTGVPFILLADRYPIPGAQPVETMAQVLTRVLELTAA